MTGELEETDLPWHCRPFSDVTVSVYLNGRGREVRVGKDGFFSALGIEPGCIQWLRVLINGRYESSQGWHNVCVFAGQVTNLPRLSYNRDLIVDIGSIAEVYRPPLPLLDTVGSYTFPVDRHDAR